MFCDFNGQDTDPQSAVRIQGSGSVSKCPEHCREGFTLYDEHYVATNPYLYVTDMIACFDVLNFFTARLVLLS
jgi:hypothetical protein